MIIVEFQCFDKAFFQFREKMQRSAEKCNPAVDRTALCKITDGLVDNCLKDRECNVRLSCAVIHEGLNIGLGKDPAARSDCIDTLALFSKRIESDRVR